MTPTNGRNIVCGRLRGNSRTSPLHFAALLLFAVLIAAGAAGAANLDRKFQFDIPPQTPLDRALIEWGRRSGMQVMVDARSVARKKALGVQGLFSARTALEALLKDTGLHYTIEGSTIAIGAGTSAPENEHSGSSELSAPPMASVPARESEAAAQPSPSEWPAASASARDEKVLEEVVVTGSNLGAAVDPVSPVQAYTRAQIDQTGLGTVAAFIQSLPQNFGGGKSDATVGNL
ncbi:MAG TPA: STN domain-containing protein, partial [Steroidobacteraceae bacterium]|nr:STN domain-containing protein [Steroidobacteraceae bacterium]